MWGMPTWRTQVVSLLGVADPSCSGGIVKTIVKPLDLAAQQEQSCVL
jgi:hypothetical protein